VELVPTFKTQHTNVTIPVTIKEKLSLLRQDQESYGMFLEKALYFYLEHNPRSARPIQPPMEQQQQLLPETIDSERIFEIAMMSDPDPNGFCNLPLKIRTRTKVNSIRIQGETYDDVTNRICDFFIRLKPPVILQKQPPPELEFNPNIRYLRSAIHESLQNVLRPYEGPRLIQHTQRPMINPRGTPMYEVWYNGYAYTLAKKMTVTTIVELLNRKLISNK
jgi:hypothetical protein